MKNKRLVPRLFIGGIVILAGIADLKYKGKMYQLFPRQCQARVDAYFQKR